ncbi:2-hydroxymuconate tautomerase family protein [Kluyvera cryocrescens]|uniref:2-hydroxymuconate tautomerase family protein n=1 Tax=Kluyvera cryocrescens TaxID=580 RepID=UPI0039F45B1C
MPYINIKITDEKVTAWQKQQLIEGATLLLEQVSNKPRTTTYVIIDEINTDNWGVGGETVTALRLKAGSPSPQV